jgi:alkanesulfonate monooxygenase SsuD/methylene tetrahydromethanopterin reductase-like flavin-dependent oxidoreductase (luciferase family)
MMCMTIRPLRSGVVLCTSGSVADLIHQGHRAATTGCDVVLLPDHLGYSAPLPSLVALAAAVPSVRVGSCVLNSAFYQPALLARDLAAVDSAADGRLEIGLGAGYVAEEFATAGLRFPRPAERVQAVADHVKQIRATFADPDYSPAPVQHAPPIMIGDRARWSARSSGGAHRAHASRARNQLLHVRHRRGPWPNLAHARKAHRQSDRIGQGLVR